MSGTANQKINRLKNLFERREKQWNQVTDRILKELESQVIPGVKAFTTDINSADIAQRIVFTAAELSYPEYYPEGLVFIWGYTEYTEGETIEAPNGEEVTLTEQDVAFLQTSVEISVPLKLATTGTAEEVQQYLHDCHAKMEDQLKEILEQQGDDVQLYPADPGDLLEQQMYDMTTQAGKEDQIPAEPLDMDLSEFTEEQKQMILSTYRQTGNIKH
jgi:hypothetical protein